MSLSQLLKEFDHSAVGGVLAAAVLAAARDDGAPYGPGLLSEYMDGGKAVVDEVRRELKIGSDDHSAVAQSSIDRFLADAIQKEFVPANDLASAFSRAAYAGRVPPNFYSVDQSRQFVAKFRTLAVRPNHVERAIKEPDDYQHPLAAEAAAESKDAVSLFVREAPVPRSGGRHWLLVQTHRFKASLVVQSAWHIFSDDVDLESATCPLDVLRAFAFKFGWPIEVEGVQAGLFAENIMKRRTAVVTWKFQATGDFFASLATTNTPDPNVTQIGIGYCIDLVRYRASLRDHGLMTDDEMQRFNREASLERMGHSRQLLAV